MLKFWLTIGVAGILLAGCADSTSDNEKETDTSGPEAVTEERSGTAAEQSEVTNTVAVEGEGADTAADQSQINFTTSTSGLNPAHGQPGHNCDIPVGEPLDGSGTQNQVTTLPTITQPVAQPNFVGGAPANGINPAHGQPGHDCAVTVGAPLPVK